MTGAIGADTQFETGDFRALVPRFAADARAANMALVDMLRASAADLGASPAQLALAWILAKAPWIVPIPGTTKLHRLAENIGAANIVLSPAQLAELDKASAAITPVGARLPAAVLAMTGL